MADKTTVMIKWAANDLQRHKSESEYWKNMIVLVLESMKIIL